MRGHKCAECGSFKIVQVVKCDLCLTTFNINAEIIRSFFHLGDDDYCPSCMLKVIDDYKKGIERRKQLVGGKP